MNELVAVTSRDDIFQRYIDTPVAQLLEYQNLGRTPDRYKTPQIIIGTCMDFRIDLHTPRNFAFIVRAGGANMRNNEFYLSFAIGVVELKHFALIGHNNCAMADVRSVRDKFITGLSETSGMEAHLAETQFNTSVHKHEIGNEVQFIVNETKRLRALYPKILIAPLMYILEENKLYQVNE